MKLRRQPIIAVAAVAVVVGIVLASIFSSKKDHEATTPSPQEAPAVQPLNISIMLDLSDRVAAIGHDDKMAQMEKDTAIIAHICNWFVERQKKHKYMTDDMMRVCFYPAPNLANISQLQDNLTVDLRFKGGNRLVSIKENKEILKQMPTVWNSSLEQIYTSTIATKKWIGSDVWSYFSHSSAKQQCVREGYRNILIIMTDGYLYHVASWEKTASGEYTGITPQSLSQQTAITPINEDMSDLEVLFLEVNPQKPSHFIPMRNLLTNWCQSMGVKHCGVVKTDVPRNSTMAIDAFLEQR